MKTIFVISGCAGTGKHTMSKHLSERFTWKLIDGESYHTDTNVKKITAGTPLTDDETRACITEIAVDSLRHLALSTDIVVSCPVLRLADRDLFREVVKMHNDQEHLGVRLVFIFLQMGEERATLLVELRQLTQGHYMPHELVHLDFKNMEPPTAVETDCAIVKADYMVEVVGVQVECAVWELTGKSAYGSTGM